MNNVFSYEYDRNSERLEASMTYFTVHKAARSADSDGKPKERGALPKILRVAEYIALWVGAIILFALFVRALQTSFVYLWERQIYFVIIAGCVLCVGLMLWAANKVALFRRIGEETCRKWREQSEETCADMQQRVHNEEDAVTLSVLAQIYKSRDINRKRKAYRHYLLMESKVFVQDGKIYFVNRESVSAVPISSIVATYHRRRRLAVTMYAARDEYRQAISEKHLSHGMIHPRVGDVASVHVLCERGDFEIVIPDYDIQKLESITDLKWVNA